MKDDIEELKKNAILRTDLSLQFKKEMCEGCEFESEGCQDTDCVMSYMQTKLLTARKELEKRDKVIEEIEKVLDNPPYWKDDYMEDYCKIKSIIQKSKGGE